MLLKPFRGREILMPLPQLTQQTALTDVVVQFYPWFKFHSPLFQTYHHTLPYSKTKENKI